MKVSCIMPTRNRRKLLPLALRCFQQQDWADRELVVLDDGDDSVEDLLAKVPGVLYMRHRGERLPIGTKRNLCCEHARGEVIVHWDDDDWSADGRVTHQMELLLSSGKQMVGYNALYYWSMTLSKAFQYTEGSPNYAVGTSMCYRRDFWQANRFPEVNYAEDNALVFKAQEMKQVAAVDGSRMLVVRAHQATTSSDARIGNNCWPLVPSTALPPEFFAALQTT
jgi:glycosyltransferase involved in cell wall biosynthesis